MITFVVRNDYSKLDIYINSNKSNMLNDWQDCYYWKRIIIYFRKYKYDDMDDIRIRIRKAMEWLKDNKLFASNRAIAERMGYNPSALSQVITGKANVSERFVKSLCGICPALSFDWIWSGEGTMTSDAPLRRHEQTASLPQMDRFSYILGDMAEIIKNMTSLVAPLGSRMERLERKVEEQAREIQALRSMLSENAKAATSRKK